MKKHPDNYLKTGDTKTPNRGRGQRISRRNLRYESGDDQGEEDDVSMPNPVMKLYIQGIFKLFLFAHH